MTAPALEELMAQLPFPAFLGVRLTAAAPDRVTASLDWAPERCTAGGVMHGGALMSLADTVGGVCAYLNLPPGAATTTVEFKINFFRGVREGRVLATARPLHVGGSYIVVQSDLTDESGRALAQATQTQAVLAPRRREPG